MNDWTAPDGSPPLWTCQVDGGVLTVHGEVDIATCDRFAMIVRAVIERSDLTEEGDPPRVAHLDLAGVGFIDVAGTRVLVAAAQDSHPAVELVVHYAPPMLSRILELAWGPVPGLRLKEALPHIVTTAPLHDGGTVTSARMGRSGAVREPLDCGKTIERDRTSDSDPDPWLDRNSAPAHRAEHDGTLSEDTSGLAEAYTRHGAAVYSLARQIVGAFEADNVTVEAFLALWREPRTIWTDGASLRTALLAFTHRQAVRVLRSDSERRARLARMAGHEVEHEALERADAHGPLSTLPAAERRVLVLAYFGGHTYREIAALLGQPENAVKACLRTGMKHLNLNVRDNGEDQPGFSMNTFGTE